MTNLKKLGFVFLFFFSSTALAQTAPAKTTGVVTGRYEVYMNSGFLGLGSGSSQYDLAPGFMLIPFARISWLQVGGELTYQKIAYRGGSTTNTVIMGDVTANIGGATINDSFFLTLGVAIRSGSSDVTDDSSQNPGGTGIAFMVGKRIPLGGAFSFRPSVGMLSGGSSELIFRPLGLSYFF